MDEGRAEREALLRQQLKAMPADQFEVLVFELAGREDPEARRLTAPDGGADTLRPATPSRRAKVWQAKRYPSQVNWQECEKSLERAVKVWDPGEIVFAFVRDFTEPVQQSFQTKLVEHPSARGLPVTAWTLTDLVGRLAANPDLRHRFFGDDQRSLEDNVARMAAAGGLLKTSADLLERARTLSEYAEEQDIDFTYAVTARATDAPAPRYDELPYISMQVSDERQSVEVAAWAREAADVGPPTFSFTDDDAGVAARADAIRQWAAGKKAVIVDGTRVKFARPEVLDGLLESGPFKLGSGELTVSVGDGTIAELELDSPDAREVRAFTVYPVPPRPGAVAAIAGYAGSVLFEVNLSLLEAPRLQASFSMSSRFGSNAAESEAAAALMYAWCAHTAIRFRCDLTGEITGQGADMDAGAVEHEEFRWRREFYADVVLIEAHRGAAMPVPEEMHPADIQLVGGVADVLRTGRGVGQMSQVAGMVGDPLQIPGLPDRFAQVEKVRQPLSYVVFGHTVNLGIAEFEIPPLKIVQIIPHGQFPDSPARVIMEPESDADAPFRLVGYLPPGDAEQTR